MQRAKRTYSSGTSGFTTPTEFLAPRPLIRTFEDYSSWPSTAAIKMSES